LQKMRDTLLGALPVRIVRDDLKCETGGREHPTYGLTVQTLQPQTPKSGESGTG